MSAQYQINVCPMSAQCLPNVCPMSAHCVPNVCPISAQCLHNVLYACPMLFAVKSPNSSDMLLYVQANLPKTSPFSPAQMTVLSIFFQAFIVLGMYNFVFAGPIFCCSCDFFIHLHRFIENIWISNTMLCMCM